MCPTWYTKRYVIRTLISDFFQRYHVISFAVIDNDLQMIVKHKNGIDECSDDTPAEVRIISFPICETAEEKQNPVTVQQLRL